MKKRKGLGLIIALILVIAIIIITMYFWKKEENIPGNENIETIEIEYDNSELDSSWDKSTAINVIFSDDSITSSNSSSASVNNNVVTINSQGVYHFTGKSNNAQIIVNGASDDNIKLVLDNLTLTCSNSAPIYVKQADKVIITLEENTINTITDTENYEQLDNNEPNATIFSKDNLVINGTGTLNVVSNYKDGIASKDNIKIISGTINVNSVDDGIRGKDYVAIKSGNINIKASKDGIKATNTDSPDVGYVVIENGNITIDATKDGIQAESKVDIKDGIINITTGGGSENGSKINNETINMPNTDMLNEKMLDIDIVNPDMPLPNNNMQNKDMLNLKPQNMEDLNSNIKNLPNNIKEKNSVNLNEKEDSTNTEESAKGIKATNNITIEGGNFTFNTSDDSIHSNGTVGILNGNFEIESGDDGIHADENLYISNGDINITKSYEGIEGYSITINDGKVYITASDDGINACGNGSTQSFEMESTNNTTDNSQILIINNGYICVDSRGDGIDVNGSTYINGGTIIVNGPTSNGDGALDYDGVFEVNGGTLIAVGSSGMLQTSSNNSKINCISVTFNSNQEAGSLVSILDSSNSEITTFAPSKTYQSIVICSSSLKTGESYKVYTGGESSKTNNNGLYELGGYKNGTLFDSITINNVVNTIGNGGNRNFTMRDK